MNNIPDILCLRQLWWLWFQSHYPEVERRMESLWLAFQAIEFSFELAHEEKVNNYYPTEWRLKKLGRMLWAIFFLRSRSIHLSIQSLRASSKPWKEDIELLLSGNWFVNIHFMLIRFTNSLPPLRTLLYQISISDVGWSSHQGTAHTNMLPRGKWKVGWIGRPICNVRKGSRLSW